MEYTQVASDAFQKLQLNAGILVDDFAPATATIGNIIGATTGGVTFASNPTYVDFGEDVDNVPANTMQLKRIQSYDPVLSGTFLTVTPALVAQLIGGADVSATTHIVPRDHLTDDDFTDIWWIGDYSDKNESGTGKTAGYIAIHVMNGLNTSGFQVQSEKDGKGQFSFEYHGHYDLTDMSEVPFEIYVAAGTST